MPIPPPSERPDLYDAQDCRVGNSYPRKSSAELRAHIGSIAAARDEGRAVAHPGVSATADIEWEFYEKDNAVFRRPKGIRTRSVHDVYRPDSKSWVRYEGDRLAPVVFGDRTTDPAKR